MDDIYQLREYPVMSLRNEFDMITVASGVVLIKDRKVLVVRESDDDKFSFPGGTCRNNESLEQTAIRECQEELSLSVQLSGSPFVFMFQRYLEYQSELVMLFHFNVASLFGELHLANDAKQKMWIGIGDEFGDCFPNVEPATRHFLHQYGKSVNYEIKES